MKHLKKYNESKLDNISEDEFKSMFQEVIDYGLTCVFVKTTYMGSNLLTIRIKDVLKLEFIDISDLFKIIDSCSQRIPPKYKCNKSYNSTELVLTFQEEIKIKNRFIVENLEFNEERFYEMFQEVVDLGYCEIDFSKYSIGETYIIIVRDFFKMELKLMQEFIQTLDFCTKRIPERLSMSIISEGYYDMKIKIGENVIGTPTRARRMPIF